MPRWTRGTAETQALCWLLPRSGAINMAKLYDAGPEELREMGSMI